MRQQDDSTSGARLSDLLSAASMRTVKTSMAVRKASRNVPRTLLMPGSSFVIALEIPPSGVRQATSPAPAMPPSCISVTS